MKSILHLPSRLMSYFKRRYLITEIAKKRPDLARKPFKQLLNTYIMDSIEEYIDMQKGDELPVLLHKALAYDAYDTKGYYRAMYFLYMHRHTELLVESCDDGIDKTQLLIDNVKLRRLAKNTVDMVVETKDFGSRLN